MEVRQYHIIMQDSNEIIWTKPFDWLEGPLPYDTAFDKVEQLNRIWNGKRVFTVAVHRQTMSTV
jgi:hypothetical protein